jgi:hypothetical protein
MNTKAWDSVPWCFFGGGGAAGGQKPFWEKDDHKRSPSLSRRLNTAVSGKPENAKHRFLDFQKLLGKFID